ncbi:MAG: hypothetical protein K9H15_05035 [Bacteroidales bacterium]|nr:hypothetical protein [Bacteroidales bacterium]
MDIVNNFFGSYPPASQWWLHPYLFVIVLVIIVGILTYGVIRSIQKTKRKRDEHILKKDEINMEAEIIKNLRELIRSEAEKAKGKDEPNKRYIYQKGGLQYSLRGEEIIYRFEKTATDFSFFIKITNDSIKYADIKKKLDEGLKDQLSKKYEKQDGIDENRNYITEFLQKKFREHFPNDSNYNAYFTNYKEFKGSFIIEFSIITLVMISHYDTARDGIDKLKSDIESTFDKIFPEMVKVKVSELKIGDCHYKKAD